MTFTKLVKNELTTIPSNHSEMLAEFAAFLNFSSEFHIENGQMSIHFQTKNPTITKRFLLLSKALYDTETELIQKEQQKFTKKPLIILKLIKNVDKIINEHDYLGSPVENMRLITQNDEEKKALLRGAFIVSGSVNHPNTKEYHLEIFSNNQQEIIYIQSLMNHFNLNARITKRRNGYIAYLKDAESISDFIKILGATNAVFKYEDIRIKRDFNNSINRIMNCEIANEKKTYKAALDQLKNIQIIKKHLNYLELDDKIVRVMDLREKYPEANLRELSEFYEHEYEDSLSRSGINHRFRKIKELASNFKEESK